MKEPVTRLDYCQYLLVNQINYTLTNFADYCEPCSHDALNRYLRGERIMPRLVWENVRGQIVPTPRGYVLFDDTVLDKNSSSKHLRYKQAARFINSNTVCWMITSCSNSGIYLSGE